MCIHCGYHFRIGARERLAMLFDDAKFEELDAEVISIDPLEFVDTKPYPTRLRQAKKGSGLPEAIINARGKVGDHLVLAGAMDMSFIGGSMGSAVGEKVTRLIERALKEHGAVVIFATSGGARMQEGALSLMQMAKISAALAAAGVEVNSTSDARPCPRSREVRGRLRRWRRWSTAFLWE